MRSNAQRRRCQIGSHCLGAGGFLPLGQSPRRGLTLVEVLVALTVLAVILLPVMVGFAQALIASNQSSSSAVASSIARQKIEDLKALGYDNILSQGRTLADLARPGDGYFQVEVAVTEVEPNDTALKGMKEVVVAVYRTGSQTPVITLTTYLSPAGV